MKRKWDWLEESEHWRIGYAFKTLRFFPRWVLEYVQNNGHKKDLEQTIQLAVFLSRNMEAVEASRLISKEIRKFLTSIMIRRRNGQWKAVEFAREDTVLEHMTPVFTSSNLIDTSLLDMDFWGLEKEEKPVKKTQKYNKLSNIEAQTKFRENNREYRKAYQRAWEKGLKLTKKEWELEKTKEERTTKTTEASKGNS